MSRCFAVDILMTTNAPCLPGVLLGTTVPEQDLCNGEQNMTSITLFSIFLSVAFTSLPYFSEINYVVVRRPTSLHIANSVVMKI